MEPDRAARLAAAITGRGAFRRFKDELARWPGELERWYALSEERQLGRARSWLTALATACCPPLAEIPESLSLHARIDAIARNPTCIAIGTSEADVMVLITSRE